MAALRLRAGCLDSMARCCGRGALWIPPQIPAIRRSCREGSSTPRRNQGQFVRSPQHLGPSPYLRTSRQIIWTNDPGKSSRQIIRKWGPKPSPTRPYKPMSSLHYLIKSDSRSGSRTPFWSLPLSKPSAESAWTVTVTFPAMSARLAMAFHAENN